MSNRYHHSWCGGSRSSKCRDIDYKSLPMLDSEINTKIGQQAHIALLTSSFEKGMDALVTSTKLPRRLGSWAAASGLSGMNLTPKAIGKRVIMGWGLQKPSLIFIPGHYDSKELTKDRSIILGRNAGLVWNGTTMSHCPGVHCFEPALVTIPASRNV